MPKDMTADAREVTIAKLAVEMTVAQQIDDDGAAMIAVLNRFLDEAELRGRNGQNVLTCVYCGHAYPPGSPTHSAEVLTAHVAECPKHPMAAVIRDRAELRAKVATAEADRDGFDAARIVLVAENEELRAKLGTAGSLLGEICVLATLRPGESAAHPNDHTAVIAMLDVLRQRDDALAAKLALERDALRRVCDHLGNPGAPWLAVNGPFDVIPPDAMIAWAKRRIDTMRSEYATIEAQLALARPIAEAVAASCLAARGCSVCETSVRHTDDCSVPAWIAGRR
jgi:hypothetical protein